MALFRGVTCQHVMFHHFMYTEPKSKKGGKTKVKACQHGCEDPITGLPFKHGNAADKCKNCGRLTEKGERKKRRRAQLAKLDAAPSLDANPVLPPSPSAAWPDASSLSDVEPDLFASDSGSQREADLYVEVEALRGQNERLKEMAKELLHKLHELEEEERQRLSAKIDAL